MNFVSPQRPCAGVVCRQRYSVRSGDAAVAFQPFQPETDWHPKDLFHEGESWPKLQPREKIRSKK
jgi:hypothetical protein